MKKAVVVAALVSLLFLPALAAAQPVEEPNAGIAVLDVIVVRPVSLVVATASTGICLATIIPASLIGCGEQWFRIMIEAPWRFTIGRPLGEFNRYRDGGPITVVNR